MSPYRRTGITTRSDVVWLLLIALVSGLVAGALASFIGQYFRIAILFPAAMGALVGAAGYWVIDQRRFHVPLVAALFGLVGGLTAFSVDHLTDYFRQRHSIKTQVIRVTERLGGDVEVMRSHPRLSAAIDHAMVAAGRGEDINIVNIIGRLGDRSVVQEPSAGSLAALRGWLAARRDAGVSLSSARRGTIDETGALGGLIFWSVSAMLAGGIASLMFVRAAARPVCASCGSWFAGSTGLLPVAIDGFNDKVEAALEQHDAEKLGRLFPKNGPGTRYLALDFRACPNCPDGEVYTELLRVKNRQGRLSNSRLLRALLPAQDTRNIAVALRTAHRHQREEAIRNVVRPKHMRK